MRWALFTIALVMRWALLTVFLVAFFLFAVWLVNNHGGM